MDKAGAYGIQGAALGFIGKIEGSYSNVVGLPVNLVVQKLPVFLGLDVSTNWRELFE
jgi:septum formation protein